MILLLLLSTQLTAFIARIEERKEFELREKYYFILV